MQVKIQFTYSLSTERYGVGVLNKNASVNQFSSGLAEISDSRVVIIVVFKVGGEYTIQPVPNPCGTSFIPQLF